MTFDPKIPYKLELLPPKLDFSNPIFAKPLLAAHRALAELKGYSFSLPNPLLLLSPAILKESLASSEIENIHTTLVEVLQNQLLPESQQNINDKEVLRYREAILWGFENMKKITISSRLIVGIQKILIPEYDGGYRKTQNVIANLITKQAIYTPPIASEIPSLINNLEKFIHETPGDIDPLIAAIIGHYQFEAIHPFGDGNGRTGRILMALHLVQANLMDWPILYISGYINRNRSEYYRLLNSISSKQSWEEFILFMLEGFREQAHETKILLLNIFLLYEQWKTRLKEEAKNIYSTDLLNMLFAYPIISPVKMGKELAIHYTTASRHLKLLVKLGFLDYKKVGRNQLYINSELINLFNLANIS